MKKIIISLLGIILFLPFTWAQRPQDLSAIEPGRFDQGKMWTFENAPKEYFKEAYGLDITDEWMSDVRQSALRFASWCSASFISPDGLILTNHHCSRGVVAQVMQAGENFDENGFYASTLADERRVPNLYVDQMVMVADITDEVKNMSNIAPDSALDIIKEKYAAMPDWQGLVLETRTFYSGGRYSLYGFKRYHDIRLVLYPELAMGYFGGDPDNFTYPRYNLDFTLWRAYDENGQPLHPQHYFKFNPNGLKEGEPVFVIGNPGSTGRYLTMEQLYYQRDVSLPAVVDFLKSHKELLLDYAEKIEDVYKKDSVVNLAFGLSNSEKAYTGRLDGMYNPVLMTKKEKKEKYIRQQLNLEPENDPWVKLADISHKKGELYAESLLLAPSALRGKVLMLIFKLKDYEEALASEDEAQINSARQEIESILKDFDPDLEKSLFAITLNEVARFSRQNYINDLLQGKDGEAVATEIFANSLLLNSPDKFFKLKAKKLDKEPLMAYARVLPERYIAAATALRSLNAEQKKLEGQIMNLQYSLSGLSSPPDATFSLRIADGVVKGYEYNGTIAPWFTTYYGLYDRHYSHEQKYPWNLPQRWLNPPMEMLKEPLNFVCTADIIGGNSGSPVVNSRKEVVGLVFDGNIESLPGYFIFDDTYNRTVAVHAGGIAAALRYIYKAERVLEELQ